MTSRAYRARFRDYRNCGLALAVVGAGSFYLATVAASFWFVIFVSLAAAASALGLTCLVGYYVTGFSEEQP